LAQFITTGNNSPSGNIFSLILSLGGIFAFAIHTYFLKKGRSEFDKPISKCILAGTLLVSIIQLALTLYVMIEG